MNIKKYRDIEKLLEETQLRNVDIHWQQWRARYYLYAGFKEYEGLNRWQGGSKTGQFEKKLMSALQALKELQINKDKFKDKKFKEMEAAIVRVANIEMSKLEIAQIKKLVKIQGVNRDELKSMQENLLKERKVSKKEIEDRSNKFSYDIKEKDFPHLKKLFRDQESKFHFNAHIRRMKVANDAITVAKTGTDIFSLVANLFPPLVALGQGVVAFLSAIPLISVIATAIPLVFESIKTWVKNKSSSKKLGATIAIGFVGAAILTAALAPIAALGMAAGLAAFGFVVQQVIPYIARHKTINALNEEIATIGKRCDFLRDKDNVLNSTTLEDKEKHFLLKEIELNWNKADSHTEEDKKELKRAKMLIYKESISKDCNNKIILQALNGKSLNSFLIEKHKERQSQLKTNVENLKALEKKQIATMINGIATVVGAVLFCIPTPPTMILGACLMGVSALVGIAIKYDLPQKIAGFFGKLFGFNKPKVAVAQPLKEEPTNSNVPTPGLDLKVENTVEASLTKGTFAQLHGELGNSSIVDGNKEDVADRRLVESVEEGVTSENDVKKAVASPGKSQLIAEDNSEAVLVNDEVHASQSMKSKQ